MNDDATLLLAWERGYGQLPYRQATTILAAIDAASSVEDVINLSIGQRDHLLLQLHDRLFGNEIHTLADCPACSETLEVNFQIDDVLMNSRENPVDHHLSTDGYEIGFRLPSSRDMADLSGIQSDERPRQLLRRCVTSSALDGKPINASSLPTSIQGEISAAIGEADPQADIQLQLNCHACGKCWKSSFDIVSFLWAQLNNWCHRLLADIHTLAKTYGWTEGQVLALSPWRRQVYLNMARQ